MNSLSSSEEVAVKPRITIAIPTYNRVQYLQELLLAILPQVNSVPDGVVEVIVSNNASTDGTDKMVQELIAQGERIDYVLNDENIGGDRNIFQCWERARGTYVWIIGDDDMIVDNAIPNILALIDRDECDCIYLSSFTFSGAYTPQAQADPFGRFAEIVTDGRYFLDRVNAAIGLLSVNLFNKDRLLAREFPPIAPLLGVHLVQFGWQFPLIHREMKIIYVWQRLVGYRKFNSGDWGIARTFGIELNRIARSYFSEEPELVSTLSNGILRYWMFHCIIEMRGGLNPKLNDESYGKELYQLFKGNWRYWLFIVPVSELPFPLAKIYHAVFAAINRINRMADIVLHHLLFHGHYIKHTNSTKPKDQSAL